METPFFCVICPMYNAEKHLDESVQSVIGQSFTNWEMILVDDGSEDHSFQKAKKWAKHDKRIQVIQHEGGINNGVSASRNLGVKHARGIWVAFLDADDVWLSNKLEKQHAIIQQYSNEILVLVYGQAKVIDEHGHFIEDKREAKAHNPLHKIYGSGKSGLQKNAFKWAIKEIFDAPTSTVVCKKELISTLNGFEEDMRFSEDALMWYRMIEKGNMYFMNEPLSYYRVHQSQWNAAATIKLKATRRFIAYERLLLQTNKINQKYISSLLLKKGFRIIVKTNIGYPYFDWKLIFQYWSRLIRNKEETVKDKLISPLVFLSELIILPVRLVYNRIK